MDKAVYLLLKDPWVQALLGSLTLLVLQRAVVEFLHGWKALRRE